MVNAGVRGVAAAREVARALHLSAAEVVLRRGPLGVGAAVVADALELPVIAELPDDRRLPAAAERGLPPLRGGRPYRAACRRLLDKLMREPDG